MLFGMGAYGLKINNTGYMDEILTTFEGSVAQIPTHSTIAKVGDFEIRSADIDFEFKLQTKDIFNANDLSPIPDLGKFTLKELAPLKEKIASSLIEGKLLYSMVLKDRTFNIEDPRRFKKCLAEWQITVNNSEDFKLKRDQQRLKSRLCEREIVDQYLAEVIFNDIAVTDEEALEFFKNNTSMFKRPQMIAIRHILLASENDAKKVRAQLRRQNFAQMAKEYSIAPEARKGGLLAPFAKTDMPQIFLTAFQMRRGQISNILKSTYGYHFIMVEKRIDAKELSLDEAMPIITSKIKESKKMAKYQDFLNHALGTIDIKSPKSSW